MTPDQAKELYDQLARALFDSPLGRAAVEQQTLTASGMTLDDLLVYANAAGMMEILYAVMTDEVRAGMPHINGEPVSEYLWRALKIAVRVQPRDLGDVLGRGPIGRG